MTLRAVAVAAVAGLALPVVASPAGAEPYQSGGYPAFGYEGRYPEQTPCKYRLQQSRIVPYGSRLIRLKFFYNGRCGGFGRIENAPQDCEVAVWRTRTPAPTPEIADQTLVGAIIEPVDPGIDYAYTKVVDNLQGRAAKAMVACGGGPFVIGETAWY
jgi:hypothetical protein